MEAIPLYSKDYEYVETVMVKYSSIPPAVIQAGSRFYVRVATNSSILGALYIETTLASATRPDQHYPHCTRKCHASHETN
jgi:hypothetical protein